MALNIATTTASFAILSLIVVFRPALPGCWLENTMPNQLDSFQYFQALGVFRPRAQRVANLVGTTKSNLTGRRNT